MPSLMKIEKHKIYKKLLWKSHRLNNKNTCTYNSYSNTKRNKKYIINNIIVVKLN